MILGIETSCDESAVALFGADGLRDQLIYSQIPLHAPFGGVVPELAARDHLGKLLPLIDQLLTQTALSPAALQGVAYTAGPGLAGTLLVGAAVAQGLARAWQVPALGIHHLEGHLLAPLLESPAPAFPFTALLVSGGHTQLMAVNGVGDYALLGESLDDAAGEAFDKTAKLLGLGYPGGPALAQLAEHGSLPGDSETFVLPKPLLSRDSLDFSFSGLKTAVRLAWEASAQTPADRAHLAYCFEDTVVAVLVEKCRRALAVTGHSRLIVAGGVGANRRLRDALLALDAQVYFPRPLFCTDNAAMIALAGYLRFQAGERGTRAITARARWPLHQLSRPGAV